MSAVEIEARFAGGSITVDHGHLTDAPDEPVVILDVPGAGDTPLFLHEARNLAQAIIDAAFAATQEKPLRRSADVDEQFRERDV